MTAEVVDHCGGCGSGDLELVLDLGSSPPTCNMRRVNLPYASETHYPLELLRCPDCTLVQLSVVVDPGEVFPPDYPYSSGNSGELHENFEDLAGQFPLGPDDLVVDIGANDGTLLSKFKERYGCRTIGVEPTQQGKTIPGEWIDEDFTMVAAQQIRNEDGPATLVTACNVLAHVDNLDEVMEGIRLLLADDGILVAENHDLASIVDGGQWDAVYHEHLRFFDPTSFCQVLRRHDLTPRAGEAISTHGGSFRMVASKERGSPFVPVERDYDFEGLRLGAWDTRAALREAVGRYNGAVAGIGATARATTVINYCGFDVEDIAEVFELPGSDKIGCYIPGTRIPVVSEERLLEEDPPAVVLFSWHMKDRIVPKLREQGYEGDIIVPLAPVNA